ncbi:IclR family transcriptional regulator domain-containing protein [Morganella morganii]
MNQRGASAHSKIYQTIEKSITTIRMQGFTITRGELTAGIGAIATPIFSHQGECIASLSISLPLSRFSDEKEQDMTEQLLQSALRISRQLGYDS